MVKVTSDSPGFIEVGEISYECEAFSMILIDKYPMLDFDLLFMKEKTKCSGEVGRMLWSIRELRGTDGENELR